MNRKDLESQIEQAITKLNKTQLEQLMEKIKQWQLILFKQQLIARSERFWKRAQKKKTDKKVS